MEDREKRHDASPAFEVCIRDRYRIGSAVFEVTQRQGGKIEMEDHDIRAALDRHWAASDANDFEAEHQIYREDAVLEYPQSGERIRGRRNIQASRFAQPSRKRFTVRRILGAADLWITEFVITYDARPSWSSETGRSPARPNTSAIRLCRGLRALNGSSGCAET
jgi:SnoaL-like domain